MLACPVRIIHTDMTLPLDQLHGRESIRMLFVLGPHDNPDELRRFASQHIAAYYDQFGAEQYGVMTPKGFLYTADLHSRSK